jgi:hypothetical protein
VLIVLLCFAYQSTEAAMKVVFVCTRSYKLLTFESIERINNKKVEESAGSRRASDSLAIWGLQKCIMSTSMCVSMGV